MNAIFDFFRRLFGLGSSPAPVTPDPCNASACVEAKKRLDAARRGFNSTCNHLRSLREIAGLLRRILVVPSWVAIVLAVIALLIGGYLGVIVLAMVGVYLLALVLLPVICRVGGGGAGRFLGG